MLVHPSFHRYSRWLIVAYAILVLGAGLFTKLFVAGSLFADVPDGAPHATAIEWMTGKSWMKADAQGNFSPERTVDRASLARVLIEMTGQGEYTDDCMRAFRETQGTDAMLMQDVARGSWYEPYVCVGLGKKIIVPNETGLFRPAAPVSFAEAAAMIARALTLPQKRDPAIWYKPAVDALAGRKAIPADVIAFEMPMTRAVLAEIVYRLRAPDPGQASLTYDAIQERQNGHPGPGADGMGELLALINAERAKIGQAPVRQNDLLEQAAQEHANDLVARGYFSHTGKDGRGAEARIRDIGYLNVDLKTCGCRSWTYRYGEIMSEKTKTAAEAFDAFMHSPLHKGILLSPDFDEAGVGRTANTWVVDFGRISRKP